MVHLSKTLAPFSQIQESNATGQATTLFTVREVARRLRVKESTVRLWIKSGALEAITLPNRGKRHVYRVHKRTLDTLLKNTSPPVEQKTEKA